MKLLSTQDAGNAVGQVLHRFFHVVFPGLPHDEDAHSAFNAGFLYGLAFTFEYTKHARAIRQPMFLTEEQRAANPASIFDGLAAHFDEYFEQAPPEGAAWHADLEAMRDRIEVDPEVMAIMPAVEDGQFVWRPGTPPPASWYEEGDWNET